MKPAKATLALVVILAGIMASDAVLAARGRSGKSGHSHGHHHRGAHARGSVFVGGLVFWPRYYYSPYYVPPIAVQPVPWGYIEQGTDSYYCVETRSYYPQVEECAGGWQQLTPAPTPPS